ncbi:MAG TPA: c-type cytochrome [Gammaproteobacteria bacterium]|nr:c-type cytochrome [Gammaproteobacteria bacterium]
MTIAAARWLLYCLCVALLLLGVRPAAAVEPIRVILELQPDIDNGRRQFAICARCHLPEAWGTRDGSYPQLAGQHVNVLMKQLLDIRSGRRANPAMRPFVQQRTIGGYQNLADVVAYISTLPMTPAPDQGPWEPASAQFGEGAEIYASRCASCHGIDGAGDNAQAYPRLQGQHYRYMQRQARLVRDGLREVEAGMAAVFAALTADQVDKALNYVSYLPIPAADLAPDADWRNPDFQ